ncbi:TPM domain-containing protein [Salibacteraceae bacterium]|nr:TPM domain-containing protein [Salibacteraceae bacterium]
MFEKPPFSKEEEAKILAAIKDAENNTSGEIRIHIEKKCKEDPYKDAVKAFERLKMTATEQRNGVLILVALDDHKFAIVGDKGINEKVPTGFWDETKDLMIAHFKEGRIADGIVEGIRDAGAQLKKFFPYQSDDINELKDDISYGKND